MAVPWSIWRDLMTPEEIKEAKAAQRERIKGNTPSAVFARLTGMHWLEEDFGYAAQDVFEALDNARTSRDAAVATSEVNNVIASSKRRDYLAARFLTRRDSPFFNHPYKADILEQVRQRQSATWTTTDQLRRDRERSRWFRAFRMQALLGG